MRRVLKTLVAAQLWSAAIIAQTPAAAPRPAAAQPAAPGAPQANPDGTYTIRRNVRIVVLDVVVTDSKNQIVTDLKKEDFHVTEAKDPQTVEYFEQTSSHAQVPQDATIESTSDLDRVAPRAPVNIVLLDEFNTRFEDMAFARYSLKKYLEKQPDKLSVPTMLVAVTLQNFTVLRDYTQNKQEIIKALDHHFVAYPWQAHQFAWVAERYGTAFLTLRRVAEAVMGHPGHKNMIWIGRGFPALNLQTQLDSEARINSEVQNCVDILRDARVTLYTVDPRACRSTTPTAPRPSSTIPLAETTSSAASPRPPVAGQCMDGTMWTRRSAPRPGMAPTSTPSPTAPPPPRWIRQSSARSRSRSIARRHRLHPRGLLPARWTPARGCQGSVPEAGL